MPVLQPTSAEDLAGQLHAASQAGHTISLAGQNTKALAGGPIIDADVHLSTAALNRILLYERNDLTISVGAGMRLHTLQQFLSSNGQMIALDPPFSETCTVGGAIATDFSGPMRRRFGTARDQIIGMTFATLDGRLIKAGGMVVKNVAGLDLAKLLVGSFGTLAVMTSVNLRVHTKPGGINTFLFSFREIEGAIAKRNTILQSALTPWAIELFSPPAATRLGRKGTLLAVRAAGTKTVLDRYTRDLAADEVLKGDDDVSFWRSATNFTSDFLGRMPNGIVVRLRSSLSDVASIFQSNSGSLVSHAGSGITDAYFTSWQPAVPLWKLARQKGWGAVIAFAPLPVRQEQELWLRSSSPEFSHGFDMMGKVKAMFDPANLLNRSRLYGCI